MGDFDLQQEQLHLDLEAFQGPFDLLLHLIKTMEVDIYDIPISEVTQQYIQHVHAMKELQLDVIGDYLVMAASLIEIKSRMLLPIEPTEGLEDYYSDIDPRAALVQQLLLYQQFQNVSDQLEQMETQRMEVYTRHPMDLSDKQAHIPLNVGEITIQHLSRAMYDALEKERLRQPQVREMATETITVDEAMNEIIGRLNQLKVHESLIFNEIIAHQSRSVIITSFMAMLELVRKNKVHLHQEELYDPIHISKSEMKG